METFAKIQSALEGIGLADFKLMMEGNHIKVIAVSNMFDSMTKVKAHQVIYRALNSFLTSGEIHALHIVTMNEEQWKKDRLLYL